MKKGDGQWRGLEETRSQKTCCKDRDSWKKGHGNLATRENEHKVDLGEGIGEETGKKPRKGTNQGKKKNVVKKFCGSRA